MSYFTRRNQIVSNVTPAFGCLGYVAIGLLMLLACGGLYAFLFFVERGL